MDELAMSPDGLLLGSACQRTRQVRLWESANGRGLAELPLEEGTLKVAFSPDGRRLAVTADTHTRVYELARRGMATFVAGRARTSLTRTLHPGVGSLAFL